MQNPSSESSPMQNILLVIKIIFAIMQVLFWGQYFWLILIEEIPALFAESRLANIFVTCLVSFLLIMTMRNLALTYLKTSIFSGDMQNLFSEDGSNLEIRSCKICDTPKSKRIHHCSLCKRCVVKMDHHSLLTGACIGKNNYKYFMSYLLYVMLDMIMLILLSFSDLWSLIGLDLKSVKTSIVRLIIMNVFGGFIFWICLGWILLQIYCLTNDITFIELMNMPELFSHEFNLLKIITYSLQQEKWTILKKNFVKSWVSYFETASISAVFFPNEHSSKLK